MTNLSVDNALSNFLLLVVVLLIVGLLELLLLRSQAFLVLEPTLTPLAITPTRHILHAQYNFTPLVHVSCLPLDAKVLQQIIQGVVLGFVHYPL